MGEAREGRRSEDRLQRLAEDVAEHFRERCEALEGKAMVVAYSRRVAAELTELLRERLGDERGATA